MNTYVFIFVIAAVFVGAYYLITDNHSSISGFLDTAGTATSKVPDVPNTPGNSDNSGSGGSGGGAGGDSRGYDGTITQGQNMPPLNDSQSGTNNAPASGLPPLPGTPAASQSSTPAPIVPSNIANAQATGNDSSAINAAAVAAASSSGATSIGTIKTLTGKTYTNCKVLKVESDGVTFNCDRGIVKLLYPVMPPEVQKMFNYDPQQAAAQTAQEIKDAHEQQAEAQAAAAHPAQ